MTLEAPALAELPGIAHAFFTREGGVSEGVWATLNVGLRSGDAPERVVENRRRCAAALGVEPAALLSARQVHGVRCMTVDGPWADGELPEADALVTDRPGLALGVHTADCAPVLLADAAAGVVAAAHAGWRGALDGILDATVIAMVARGASPARVRAVVGPCIGQASYEVGPEFRERFVAAGPASHELFLPVDGSDRWRFDLERYVVGRLRGLGVGSVAAMAVDTCRDETRFFSFRRTTLRREDRFGLQLSAIGRRA